MAFVHWERQPAWSWPPAKDDVHVVGALDDSVVERVLSRPRAR
jgi:hypothetical protein